MNSALSDEGIANTKVSLRSTPLAKSTVIVLTAWIREQGEDDGTRILFPTARGGRLSADTVQHLVRKCAAVVQETCPSLTDKRVSPHILRHTTAMELLQSGVDRTLIALWLGHESVETTQIYLDANLAIKEEILAKTTPINAKKKGRYLPDDDLLTFLKRSISTSRLCRIDLMILVRQLSAKCTCFILDSA